MKLKFVYAPEPFSYVKSMDIRKVVNRLKNHAGQVWIADVYLYCRPRIPGILARYEATIAQFGKYIQ